MQSQLNVLVVDDEPAIRMTLESVFADAGWCVRTADTAEEALEQLQKISCDVLVTDKNLPGINGVKLIREARRVHRDLVALLITGYASVESAEETLHLDVDGYLEKPFEDVYGLVEKVRLALARRKRAQPLVAIQKARASVSKGASGRLRFVAAISSEGDRAWLRKEMESTSCELCSVNSAVELSRHTDQERPDMLFLDASLKELDIFQVIAKLRAKYDDLAIVVIADAPSLRDLVRLIDLKVQALVRRPLDHDQFQRRVGSLVELVQIKASASDEMQPRSAGAIP